MTCGLYWITMTSFVSTTCVVTPVLAGLQVARIRLFFRIRCRVHASSVARGGVAEIIVHWMSSRGLDDVMHSGRPDGGSSLLLDGRRGIA